MKLEPYLFFDGRAEEAIAFYEAAVGAKREMMMRFSESPDPILPGMLPEGGESRVMHAALVVGESRILISDGCAPAAAPFHGFALTVSVTDEAEADRVFEALADGGETRMPLGKTFFSPRFGMLTDRFGVAWTVVTEAAAVS